MAISEKSAPQMNDDRFSSFRSDITNPLSIIESVGNRLLGRYRALTRQTMLRAQKAYSMKQLAWQSRISNDTNASSKQKTLQTVNVNCKLPVI